MTDSSEANQVQYMAIGGGVDHFAMLRSKPVEQWKSIEDNLRKEWSNTKDAKGRQRINDLSGCLEKLSTCLLQAQRIRNHHDDLLVQAKMLVRSDADSAALRGAIACADFEGFLLQGRAALDRMSWFVASSFKNRSSNFKKLPGILTDFRDKSADAKEILELIDSTKNWFEGTFGKVDSPHSLRDLVAHRHSLVEGTRTCFGANRISKNRVLLIDCEIQLPGLDRPTPILATTHESIANLSYLVLNVVSIFSDVKRLLRDDYESLWHNRTVPLSRFVITQPEGSPLGPNVLRTVRNMQPDGFVIGQDNVDPKVFRLAVEC